MFHTAEKLWKTKYTATARNKINLYRSNHVSTSAENLTEYLWSYYEPTGKISDLTKHYTRHEKIAQCTTVVKKNKFYR